MRVYYVNPPNGRNNSLEHPNRANTSHLQGNGRSRYPTCSPSPQVLFIRRFQHSQKPAVDRSSSPHNGRETSRRANEEISRVGAVDVTQTLGPCYPTNRLRKAVFTHTFMVQMYQDQVLISCPKPSSCRERRCGPCLLRNHAVSALLRSEDASWPGRLPPHSRPFIAMLALLPTLPAGPSSGLPRETATREGVRAAGRDLRLLPLLALGRRNHAARSREHPSDRPALVSQGRMRACPLPQQSSRSNTD